MDLESVSSSVRLARDLVRHLCADAGTPPETTDTALLLTSELVTNAVLHGEGSVALAAEVEPRRIRVTVTDDGTGVPHRRRSEALLTEGGRGLLLVDRLATQWGVLPAEPAGKTVWFELADR